MNHYQERVYLQGHIIDSLVLAKVLDLILMMGGTFDLEDVHIGKTTRRAVSCPYRHPSDIQSALRRHSESDSTARRLDRT